MARKPTATPLDKDATDAAVTLQPLNQMAIMMDMGSANTSGLFKNLARRLKVKLLAHAPGNARATGQVENARNIIERSFESSLRLQPVANLVELNAMVQRWATSELVAEMAQWAK